MKSKLFKMLPALVAVLLFASPAFADEAAAAAGSGDWKGYLGIGAGIALGLAVHGAGLGQGRIAGSALEGMARNPQAAGKLQISMLLALAFPESLVLFALIIGFMLAGKIV